MPYPNGIPGVPGSAPQQQQQSQVQQPQDPSAIKLTRGTSCVLCQQRKVRCDKNKPCANCVKAKVECRVIPPQPPRRRKKRLQEKDLIDRLKKYETLLAEHGVKVDAIGHELRPDGPPGEDVEELENDFEGLKTTPEASSSPAPSNSEQRTGGGAWFSYHKELWQIYIDNINPLLKITHVPTVQAQIIEASSDLENAPKNIEALMFSMYLMAITSLEDADVYKRFNETKKELLARYHTGTQHALTKAGFMRVNDPILLQAYILYLVEQRRRLWWTLVGYDRRLGEMAGSTVTALSTGGDCKIPMNVNDSDLHVDGKEFPTPHSGPTEMLFSLTRVELAMAVSSDSNRDSYKMNNTDKSPAGTPASKNQATIRLAGQDGPAYTLDGFCAHIEGTYLSQCDPKIPLHFFTLTMTRQAMCKMRIISFLVRMHSNDDNLPLKDVERDSLFLQATQMIEYDNVVQSSESLRPFKWYSMHHFPFPAYMFLVQELRHRVSGPMVERAWDAIEKNHDLRGLLNNYHNPMHMAFGGHFIKAWDAHEAALIAAGRQGSQTSFLGAFA
uniref:Zn(2)-C6 fungal-type domain-containing protein n=1 Tax=Fusarium oxysporum (strain Fo5176) TaxID=660025 RepID=A0A0D2XQQ0_FUSOF